MRNLSQRKAALLLAVVFLCGATVRAQNLDMVGLNLLRAAVATNVDGTGIRVAQPEAGDGAAANWEVNPNTVGVATNLFTYTSSLGTTNSFPNAVGSESTHGHDVGNNFYGPSIGLATNVTHVDNYEANYFYDVIIATNSQPDINDAVVNQSFVFGTQTSSAQQMLDSQYDNYAAKYQTLFVSGAGDGAAVSGNNGFVEAPATCYNGIGVAAYRSDAQSSIGPTIDNGRAKPDITGPAGATSYSTPQVAGASAALMQAGLRGDGGSDTNSAADMRTVKALLLNGAVKPADWTNATSSPLDARYGAGVLNIFNSYEQLTGGKNNFIVATSVSTGAAHPPTGNTGTVAVLSGWDFNTNSSGNSFDEVNHYYFNATNGVNNATFTAIATLVWNRHQNKSGINNLNLFLYNAANSNLVTCSTSLVDNVEHIFVPKLAQGRYDLQVWKKGGTTVSTNETYALAFEFFSQSLNAVKSGANVALSWPVYPAGFLVESTTNLLPPAVWITNSIPAPAVTNNQNFILLNVTNASQFFRLQMPNL
jgi:hypothetical protein